MDLANLWSANLETLYEYESIRMHLSPSGAYPKMVQTVAVAIVVQRLVGFGSPTTSN